MGLVENANSCFPTPISIFGPRSSDPGLLMSSSIDQATITIPFATTTSPSTPTSSCPYTSCSFATNTNCISSSNISWSGKGCFPSLVSWPQELRSTYAMPYQDPQGRWSTTLSISKECHVLSRTVELANYMKSLASARHWKEMSSLFGECLINNSMHSAVHVQS